MINDLYYRKTFLEDLGENNLPASELHRVDAEQCFSSYNPPLAVKTIPSLSRLESLKLPRDVSEAANISPLLETFA